MNQMAQKVGEPAEPRKKRRTEDDFVAGMAARKAKQKTMTKAATPKSWRDVYKVHPAADLFPLMSQDELRELGDDINKNGLTSPVALWAAGDQSAESPEYQLLDGRNRLDAMELVGLRTVDESGKLLPDNERLQGSLAHSVRQLHEQCQFSDLGSPGKYRTRPNTDPHEYVLSVNIRRRHLTTEQKRELIGKLLKTTPDKSDREIGKLTGTSKNTVAAIRGKMEARGQIDHVARRTDTKGRQQPARKSVRPAKVLTEGEKEANKQARLATGGVFRRNGIEAPTAKPDLPAKTTPGDDVGEFIRFVCARMRRRRSGVTIWIRPPDMARFDDLLAKVEELRPKADQQ
jgi:ParB/Sulfiredoxin domain